MFTLAVQVNGASRPMDVFSVVGARCGSRFCPVCRRERGLSEEVFVRVKKPADDSVKS